MAIKHNTFVCGNTTYIYCCIAFNQIYSHTDEDPGLRIKSYAVINLLGVSTKQKYYKLGLFTFGISAEIFFF
jgi:hypothetical protein